MQTAAFLKLHTATAHAAAHRPACSQLRYATATRRWQSCRCCPGGRSALTQCRPRALRHRQEARSPACSAQSSAEVAEAAAVVPSFSSVTPQPVVGPDGSQTQFPPLPGVFAVYSPDGAVQFIGLSRKVAVTIATHAADLPELTAAAKVATVADASKENLTAAWKQWIQEAVAEAGAVPPGNAPGETKWTKRAVRVKPELKLTPGKGLADLTCSVEELIDQVVKGNKVVAFIKGTRSAPQCGFSHRVLVMLNQARADYEVVNVLDDQFNPGLRDAIKTYSDWPTIPQVYINGEFVGGADILEGMANDGTLQKELAPAK